MNGGLLVNGVFISVEDGVVSVKAAIRLTHPDLVSFPADA
jgi:hypothetical protein